MNSRERIKTIIAGGTPDRCGFWLGMPHADTWPIYLKHFGCDTEEQVRRKLGDEILWAWADREYKHPEGKPLFNFTRVGISEGAVPVFANCTDVSEVEAYDWPKPEYFDYTGVLNDLKNAGDLYRASGLWTCFFHIVADLFGMENYFVKMYTDPEVVDAVTRKVCDFYLEANRQFFELAGDEMDAFFFGNDLGTQLDLIVSPDMFDRFILPDIKRFSDLAHSYNYQVMIHSCGAIHKLIDKFIEAGVDALHPLQAKAENMSADILERDFKGRIAFIGGIDTQELLVHGTPEDVRKDVQRVKAHLSPNFVVSPSHEALLPNVSPENVLAMAQAAVE